MNQKLKRIENLLLYINLGIFLFLAGCVFVTTDNVIKSSQSTEFMFGASAIVFDASRMMIETVIGSALCLMVAFDRSRRPAFRLAMDTILAALMVMMVARLGFNYNGAFLYLFARVLSEKDWHHFNKLFLGVCVTAFVVTDKDVMGTYATTFYIQEYINFYQGFEKQLLNVILAMLKSINSLVFVFYCATYIRVQYENIEKINFLYSELEKVNSQLVDYAVEREKYGEINERNRIAREIHDTLGHTMTTLSYGLQMTQHMIDYSVPETKEQIRNLYDVASKGMDEIRRSVRALEPQELLHHQLEERIRILVATSQRLTDIEISCQIEIKREEFKEDEALVIYRVIQESMTNCFKHSQAKHLSILLREMDNEIYIHIRDDGVGFSGRIKGFGTTHLRQRVELLGGTVHYHGEHGFETTVRLPLRLEDGESIVIS